MMNFNKIFNQQDKSTEDLMRERLSKETGNSWLIIGAVWCGIGLFWALMALVAGEGISVKVTSAIIFILLLSLLIFLVRKYVRQKNALEGILEAFLAGERNISNIAISVDVDNKTVANLIQTMISKKIIINAHIDKINNKIVDNLKTTGSTENVGKIVICSGCGAKNTLNGKVGQKCEYCGAGISEELIIDK